MTLVSFPLTDTDVKPGPIAALNAYSTRMAKENANAEREKGRGVKGQKRQKTGGQRYDGGGERKIMRWWREEDSQAIQAGNHGF